MTLAAWHRRAIDAYFSGGLDAAQEARMRVRLTKCPDCRARYERHLRVEAALSAGETRAEDRLWRSIERATGRAGAVTPGRRAQTTGLRLATAALGLGAAALILVALPRRAPPPGARTIAEPVARGGGDAVAAPPSLHVFRSISPHAAEPVSGGAAIHGREGLLFAYSNSDPALTHLMVFAVDAASGVHWYYPAFVRAGENPEAIAIGATGAGIELREEIRHDMPAGPLRVVGLFLREPRRVLEIEALVRARAGARTLVDGDVLALPIAGSIETSIMLRVVP